MLFCDEKIVHKQCKVFLNSPLIDSTDVDIIEEKFTAKINAPVFTENLVKVSFKI